MSQEPEPVDLNCDPMTLFGQWFEKACASQLEMPEAMTLATANASGHPDARIVLMKGWDDSGFQFFTNYQSQKARDLTATPHAAAVFWWEPLLRQVRIRGKVERLSKQESDAYFQTRGRNSQIGAWASQQSQTIANRAVLERAVTQFTDKFDGDTVPRPPHWGGFRIRPREIEFWQEQPHRLHDRILFRREGNEWSHQRLSP